MKTNRGIGWLLSILVWYWAAVAGAGQVYRWGEVFTGEPVPEGARVDEAAGALVVEGTPGAPRTIRLLTIDEPGVEGMTYGLSGRVAYQGVEGEGYLEMWSLFADGTRYFSRTLADGGPMGKIAGTSPGREFLVPFDRSGAPEPPVGLEVNLVLPGAGAVTLGEVTLGPIDLGAMAAGRKWMWAGLLGAIVGGLAGVVALWRRRAQTTQTRKMKAMDM